MRLREPPRIKVLEAAGAIADGRVRIEAEGQGYVRATVVSSEGDRTYRVVVREGQGEIRVYSDDNGTKLRGYVGYPIISVLMLRGLLPRDEKVEQALKGVDWRRLNETYKKYSVVEDIVLSKASSAVPRRAIEAFRDRVMREIRGKVFVFDEGLANA